MSAATQHVAAPRVGADLAAARQRLGYSLAEMAAVLRMRVSYLAALEEGRTADLPGKAYALAFLRTYAGALGLDPDELSRRFKAEAADINKKTELAFPAPLPERGLPAGAVILLGLILAVGAYVGWYRLSGESRLPAEAVPPVPAKLASLADQARHPTPSGQTATASAARPPPAPSPAPSSAPQTEPKPSAQAAVAAATSPPLPVPQPAVQPVPPSSAAAATPAGSTPPAQPSLLVRASVDAWIQVRQRSGPVLLSRILHAGETWSVPNTPNLLLTTGNAGGTELVIDGTVTPPLGGLGVVRRDLPLDPAAIRNGKLTAAAAAAR